MPTVVMDNNEIIIHFWDNTAWGITIPIKQATMVIIIAT